MGATQCYKSPVNVYHDVNLMSQRPTTTTMSSLVTSNSPVVHLSNTLNHTTDTMVNISAPGKQGTKEQAKPFTASPPMEEEEGSASTSGSEETAALHDDGFGGEILRHRPPAEDRFKNKKPRPRRPNIGVVQFEAEMQQTRDPSHSAMMSYHHLLQRAHKQLEKKFPNRSIKKKLKCPPPILRPYNGHKRAAFVNASQICRTLNRPITHLEQFLADELATTTFFVDETKKKKRDEFSGVIILKYRMNKKAEGQIGSVLKNYIKTYVQCSACGGFQTEMKKEQRFRSHILCCTDCHAEKYLNPISNRRTRFTARTREDKFAARRAAATRV